jgi:hypothetical protein
MRWGPLEPDAKKGLRLLDVMLGGRKGGAIFYDER